MSLGHGSPPRRMRPRSAVYASCAAFLVGNPPSVRCLRSSVSLSSPPHFGQAVSLSPTSTQYTGRIRTVLPPRVTTFPHCSESQRHAGWSPRSSQYDHVVPRLRMCPPLIASPLAEVA